MNIQEQIRNYTDGLPAAKREEIESLHETITEAFPDTKLWFFDGKNDKGKVVSNPQIGYGQQTIKYADGKTREFYRVGLSANTAGISVYIMGIDDKNYLPGTYGKTIGKAVITGYCIKFRTLKDIDTDVLTAAVKDGLSRPA